MERDATGFIALMIHSQFAISGTVFHPKAILINLRLFKNITSLVYI
jgi:hypothetical protein